MPEEAVVAIQELDDRESVGKPSPVEVTPAETAEHSAVGNTWLTPGSYLSREVASRPEVVAIVERVEPERHCVVVALKSDPDELLDVIFDAEREMVGRFEKVPFDLRVTVPESQEALESILRSGIVHYPRR